MTLSSGAKGVIPTMLPWLLGAALIALIGLGFWVGHRISHRLRENRTPLVA